MKISSQRDKRNYIIIALCLIVVIMGVGYAAFSSLLTINGTANISNSWCVGFDNTKTSDLQITKGVSTGTTPTGSMSYSGTACGTNLVPTSSLASHFYQPGDQIEYTLTITNKSTVTAAIKSILVDNESVTSDTTKKKDNITYIVEMPESTTLAPNASTTMKVTAKFQNDTDVTGPYSGETKTIEVKINAEQDDGNGGIVVTNPYTGTIYRWSTTSAKNGDSIVAGSKLKWCAITIGPSDYYNSSCDNASGWDTQEECETTIENWGTPPGYSISCEQKTVTFPGIGVYTTDASTLNKTYYLKHDVVDDIITESYVCFVYNNAEHCMNGLNYSYNTQIIKEYQAYFQLELSTGGYDNSCFYDCYGTCFSRCSGGEFYRLEAVDSGNVNVNGSSSERCIVDVNTSRCYE